MPLTVHRIVMPTPYGVGPVNSYLIEAEPLTIVDAGFQSDAAKAAFVEGLKDHGHDVHDIRRVLVTHGHPDHYGLVPWLHETTAVEVYFPTLELERMTGPGMRMKFGRLLLQAGIPLELLMQMEEHRKKDPRPWLDTDKLLPVHDGDVFTFDTFELQAHLLPGHSGGHVVYLEPESRTLFAGDQLLPHVSPNPLLEPSVDDPDERRRSLEDYLGTLAAMAAMDPSIAYPGHGDAIMDPRALIERTIDLHLARKGEIAALLGEVGRSPFELARELYPNVTGYDIFLSVSEVIAHLDLVVDDGAAVIEERDGVAYYRAA